MFSCCYLELFECNNVVGYYWACNRRGGGVLYELEFIKELDFATKIMVEIHPDYTNNK